MDKMVQAHDKSARHMMDAMVRKSRRRKAASKKKAVREMLLYFGIIALAVIAFDHGIITTGGVLGVYALATIRALYGTQSMWRS